MSGEVLTQVLHKAATDPAYRARLRDPKADALSGLALSDDERVAMQELVATPSEPRPWPSFKELGAAVLSVVLVLMCVSVLASVIYQIDSEPTEAKVGGATVVVDGFARAKELLGIVFPLLTATVTFWLGVAVEGRRADANQKVAAEANDQRVQAGRREESTRKTAVHAITELENALGGAQSVRTGSVEHRGGPPPAPPAAPDLDRLRDVVSTAKTRLLS